MAKPEATLIKKRLYSIQEAAHYLGRTPWGIRELIYAGRLPAVKAGRRVHVDINDLERFVECNKERQTDGMSR